MPERTEMIFYENLRNVIIKQAVDDYLSAARQIVALKKDKQKIIIRTITNGLKLQNPKFLTYEQAEQDWQNKIARQRDTMESVEYFFRSYWYKQLCDISGEYMIAKTKERALKVYGIDCDLL